MPGAIPTAGVGSRSPCENPRTTGQLEIYIRRPELLRNVRLRLTAIPTKPHATRSCTSLKRLATATSASDPEHAETGEFKGSCRMKFSYAANFSG